MKDAAFFFGTQFLNYLAITWNMRSVAMGWLWQVALSDALISLLSFTIVKRIAERERRAWSAAAYAAGGTLGSLVAMLITRG